MEVDLPSPPPSPIKDCSEPPQSERPPGLVHSGVENIAGPVYGSAIWFRTIWDQRVRDQAGTDGDVNPEHRPTTYEMIMTLFILENLRPLPNDPLPPPTAPARPPFQFDLLDEIDIEECAQVFEPVLYRSTVPERLLPIFNELGQIIWSNDWLRFFLIRQPHRLPIGADMCCGVFRWWVYTGSVFMAAFLEQKMDSGLKVEVNHYIPAAQGIKTSKEWDKVWATVIDEVAKVRRKLDAGVSMVFYAKLAEERNKTQKDTLPPTPHKRRTPRSLRSQELRLRSTTGVRVQTIQAKARKIPTQR